MLINRIKRNIGAVLITLLLAFLIAPVCLAQTQIAETKLENPLGGQRGLEMEGITIVVAGVIQYVLGVVGSITLLVFLYGGVLWLTSAGKADQVAKGTKTMLYAIIGIAVIFSSYVILSAIITGLTT